MPDDPPRQIPLNEIQRTMLRWNSLHPYNVVDLVEVLRPLTADQLRAATKIVLGEPGLGIPRPDEAETSTSFMEAPDRIEVSCHFLGPEEKTALGKFLTDELNRPFAIGRDAVLRLALLEGNPRRYAAMTYQHWVMDGVAAARILRRILAEALEIPREHGSATELDMPLCDRLFAHRRRGIAGVAQKSEGLRGLLSRTRATAPWQQGSRDTFVEARIIATPEGSLDRLRSAARHYACTVNDILLAGIFRAIDIAVPERRRSFWHRSIAICNIADLRKLAPELQEKSGVFVGFFGTHLGALPQDHARLIDLIRHQTSRAKKLCIPLASLTAFRTIPRLWNLLPTKILADALRAFFPYSAGLSNLRLGPEWEDPKWSGVVRGYTRACPLGMMLPLIFGVTARGGEFTMTMTSTRSAYRQEQLDSIAASIEGFLAGDFRTSDSDV